MARDTGPQRWSVAVPSLPIDPVGSAPPRALSCYTPRSGVPHMKICNGRTMQNTLLTKVLPVGFLSTLPAFGDTVVGDREQTDFALLLLAVAMPVIGLFLIRQASKAQAWLLGERSGGLS